MFGGGGGSSLYHDDVMFGLVALDVLSLWTADLSREIYKRVTMPELLLQWVLSDDCPTEANANALLRIWPCRLTA